MPQYETNLLNALLDPVELFSLDISLELKVALDRELGEDESEGRPD